MRNSALVLKALMDEVDGLWWWHRLIPSRRFLRMTDAMMRQAIVINHDTASSADEKVMAKTALTMHDRLIRPIWYS